jgi:hypothetical protein
MTQFHVSNRRCYMKICIPTYMLSILTFDTVTHPTEGAEKHAWLLNNHMI